MESVVCGPGTIFSGTPSARRFRSFDFNAVVRLGCSDRARHNIRREYTPLGAQPRCRNRWLPLIGRSRRHPHSDGSEFSVRTDGQHAARTPKFIQVGIRRAEVIGNTAPGCLRRYARYAGSLGCIRSARKYPGIPRRHSVANGFGIWSRAVGQCWRADETVEGAPECF